jgi:TRAP-type C4-dicarboxylate transport system, small permease component
MENGTKRKRPSFEIEEVLLSIMLLSMLVICSMQVIWRYVIQMSLSWSEELARYIFVWLVWLAAAYATKKMRHLRISFLKEAAPQKYQWVFDMVSLCAMVVFAVIMSVIAVDMMGMIVETGQMSPAMGLPMWIPYMAVPVGMVLIGFRAAQNVFYLWTGKLQSHPTKEEGDQ